MGPGWNKMEDHVESHLFMCFMVCLPYLLIEIQATREMAGITGASDRLIGFRERVVRHWFIAPIEWDLALLLRVSRVKERLRCLCPEVQQERF
jgi:hypothetical protein